MNLIEKFYRAVSPEKALKREVARRKLEVMNSGYSRHGASSTKKSLLGWLSKGGDPDADIVENLEKLRERSRDLSMGSPLISGAIKTIRTNVIGSGLNLNPTIDYNYLGITEEQADEWEHNVEREWALWANNKECDAARMATFGQLQSLVIISALTSGDIFCALPVIKRAGAIYDLRVALIEGDRVCDPTIKDMNLDILGGVEIGEWGEPKYYHIAKYHPLSLDPKKNVKNEWKRVPVFGSRTGRRNILHICQDLERPGQRRASPLSAVVMELSKQLSRYTEAEIMNQVISSMFTVFVKSVTPQTPLGEGIPTDQQVDSADPDSYELGSGAIVGLGENEDVTVANPSRTNAGFDSFVTALCRQIGAHFEVPYELLLKHFTSSYSASRAALLEAWKMFKMRRTWMIQDFCQPIYEEWLAEAVAKGRINAPGFFQDPAVRAAWSRAEWYGPTQGQLDPLKEANAARVRVEEDFSTREREAAELTGMSYEIIHPIRVKEERKRRQAGLGVYATIEQTPKPVEQDEEEEEEEQDDE